MNGSSETELSRYALRSPRRAEPPFRHGVAPRLPHGMQVVNPV